MQFGTAKLFAFPAAIMPGGGTAPIASLPRSEEHTSELQSQSNLVCRLLLEKKKSKCSASASGTEPPDGVEFMVASTMSMQSTSTWRIRRRPRSCAVTHRLHRTSLVAQSSV